MNDSILYLSNTWEGKMHDKMICDTEQIEFIKKVVVWMDTRFQGYNPLNAQIKRPTKKPKGAELTVEQKKNNKEISHTRVTVEHTIGKFKVFRIVKDQIRAYKDNFHDTVIFLACVDYLISK